MPYYPNYQPQFATQEELLMFQQFKMQQMHQQQPQQLPNQFTTSQPHSEQQSHHLEVEDTEDEEEPLSTPTSKPSRGGHEELLLAECFIQVSEDPKTGCDQKRDTFWYKIQNVYNKEAKKKGFTERTKNMLTGTLTSASDHIITAVIGSGLLSLAWAIAQLGWIAGPAVLLMFLLVTYFTLNLLADSYRTPDPVYGKRNYTYMDVVQANLGGIKVKLCGMAQYANLVGTTIGYTITAAISIVAVKKSNCYHYNGHNEDCKSIYYQYMIMFGEIQIVLSQIQNFHKLSWLSMVATVMSIAYSTIGIGLSIAKAAKESMYGTSLTGLEVELCLRGQEKD
ncbi:amino acid permease 6-like protein [Tanacetum coccineum]